MQTSINEIKQSNRVVAFADVLGFSALVEENPIDVQTLYARNRPLSMSVDEILNPSKNRLTEVFSKFHRTVQWTIETAEEIHPLTAITFSDSVFIATDYFYQATSFATNLMQSMLEQKVPIRMGIAYGSFAALRFSSNFSVEGGNHAAQFLGTAIVRAHQTEACGIKGMRILLHPSIEPLIENKTHNPDKTPIGTYNARVIRCADDECTNKVGINYELNYWDLKVGRESDIWRSLHDLCIEVSDLHKNHYQATAAAINRMRVDRGAVSLKNLGRRTLPKHK